LYFAPVYGPDIQEMSSPTQQNEARRLKVLWQYEVLDTVPEEIFDQLTELAACICEAPIALISLVDEDRQWFKSRVGTDLQETSRKISFCAHAIKQHGLFIVPDARKDRRFADNPLVVSEPHIRFYAGAPLVTVDGYALGTLCVLDTVPRELRSEQKQALMILARHIVSQLELRRSSLERARDVSITRVEREQSDEPQKRKPAGGKRKRPQRAGKSKSGSP
jgi:GAF domain-containing protein